jgi:hypothetical protein
MSDRRDILVAWLADRLRREGRDATQAERQPSDQERSK